MDVIFNTSRTETTSDRIREVAVGGRPSKLIDVSNGPFKKNNCLANELILRVITIFNFPLLNKVATCEIKVFVPKITTPG